ncbi:hypothetical protein R9C00_16845 [Flammeovirgaceae bacterium SG7u.111]|nr:hypothetical protein [Flammeovirgaceae bacterium SG7u.132]WPO33369.1 hypothetical protein R9C00_16845 [Flammeovirgaceae bacterium SG7u.111]
MEVGKYADFIILDKNPFEVPTEDIQYIAHVAYYDLFRLENRQIAEHWDVIAPIPAESDWKNTNGKF